MADAAEGDEVCKVVVRGVAVEMVDVEVISPAADGASLPVALEHGVPDLLPPREAVLLPRPDGDFETFTVDEAAAPRGKSAPAAEPAKTVPGGIVSAERGTRTIKCIQAELNLGAHDLELVGRGTG
ncbi:MAG: hypothetical protein PWR25_1739 [Euryarchaeota archaeon]|jgi:hypothetical protein|nr:hypothetical protein [Euryarchaeota archaeon]